MKKIIILIFLMLLTSCTSREPNEEAYISAIGIDKGEKSEYGITIQFAIPENISGGEKGGGEEGKMVENIYVDSSDVYSAVNLANHMMSKRFSLSHMKLIVFSDDVAKKGISNIMEGFITSDEIRPNLLTAVSRGRAGDYLKNTKPLMEKNPTKYYHMIYEKNNTTGIPAAAAINVISDLKSKDRDAVIPLAGIVDDNKAGENDSEGFDKNNPDYKAGEVNIIEESKSEVLGMAVFSGDKLMCEMGKKEADIYNILIGKYKNNFASFNYGRDNIENITMKLNETKKPIYDIDINNEKIEIKIYMEAECSSVPETAVTDKEGLKNILSDEISKKCREFIIQSRDEYNSDVLGIGKKIKKYFYDMDAYNSLDFRSRFRNYKINVNTNITIKPSVIIKK